jgi:antitoxin (DNA-binding transcriptional repressor) of toxin-antitoxin stability system
MKKISLSKASRSLAQYASELNDEVIVVTKGRAPVAALVPLKNVDRESLALSTHPEFMRIPLGPADASSQVRPWASPT